jgi:hypothetical protein
MPPPAGDPESDNEPLVRFQPALRESIAAVAIFAAALHLFWPTVPIDLVSLGLIAFALFILFFDIERIEWLGMTARRKEIQHMTAAVESVIVPSGTAAPPDPPIPDDQDIERSKSHTRRLGVDVSAVLGSSPAEATDLELSSPVERLLWTHEQIRIELIILAGNSGRLPRRQEWKRYSISQLLEPVRETGLLRSEIVMAIREVNRARNEIAHGAQSRILAQPTSDLATEVLVQLRALRRNYIRVKHGDVALYSDVELRVATTQRGVLLIQINDDGGVANTMVHPKATEYSRGRFVAWEWDMSQIADEAWYRDPETGVIKKAFSTSATFVGRQYPDEWNLEFRLPNPSVGLE